MYLCTTRFSDETHTQNRRFCELNRIQCYYSNRTSIPRVPLNAIMYVLELNINQNKIMGIGRVKKSPIYDNINVYKDGNYNSMVNFIGDEYLNCEFIDEEWLKKLHEVCFIGRGHLKRGDSISKFPMEKIKGIEIFKILSEKFNKKIK